MSSWSSPTGASKRQRLVSFYTGQLYCIWSWRSWCMCALCTKRCLPRMLMPWFHALDHTNYWRWIPVHLRDMLELSMTPWIAQEFHAGNFMVQKTNRPFSAIPVEQAHEQNNAAIKGDGGAVGLTDKWQPWRRWMVAGPEVARFIEEFQDATEPENRTQDTKHHDQSASVQTAFLKNVQSVIWMMDDCENSFEEDSQDLLVLSTQRRSQHHLELRTASFVHTKWARCRLITLSENAWWRERNPQKMPSTETSSKSSVSMLQNLRQRASSTCNPSRMTWTSSRLYIGCQNRDRKLGI